MKEVTCIRQEADIEQINNCRNRIDELSINFDYLSNAIELAGNKVRLKILFLLNEETKLCVCDLSDVLGMTIPAVSQHLRKLKDRGLVYSEKERQTIFYFLQQEYKDLLTPFFELLETKSVVKV